MTRYLVKEVSSCPKCEGDGFIVHPLWQELYKVNPRPSLDEVSKFFEERGFSNLPPEEIECPACQGRGTVERWIPLEKALAAISKSSSGSQV